MSETLDLEFEKAIRLLTKHAPISDEKSRKPMLPHDIRVGVYLYENGYSRDIVLAGMIKVIEIWSKERFEEEMKKTGVEIDKSTNFIADLGI